MKNSIVTLGVYFEVKDSEMYGGEGTVGYVNTNCDLEISALVRADVCDYVEKQIKGVANMCKVDAEKVKVISRTEYEENTEEDIDFDKY